MVEKVFLKLKDKEGIICNEAWYNNIKNKEAGYYEIIKNRIVSSMEDLIQYCLTYYYDIDIPKDYKVTTIYSIVFCTGDFDPESRTCSKVNSSIIYSNPNEIYIRDKFKTLCKLAKTKSKLDSKNYFCWHTEDFASNQIIHSYNVVRSYLVEKM